MKINELRIENLVSYRGESECIVSNLGNSFEALRMIGGNLQPYGSDDIEEYEPIPLTETWLIKLGFVRCKYSFRKYFIERSDFDFNIDLEQWSPVTGDYDGVVTFKCPEFVHQLQNLYFALTGEELTLNNA